MKKLFVISLLTLVALTALLPASTSRAGDVIDYLPEVQTARSVSAVAILSLTLFGFDPDDCDQLPLLELQNNISDHLLYDENGKFFDVSEIRQNVTGLICLSTTQIRPPTFSEEEAADIYFEIIQGNVVELPSGRLLDGAKQSLRAYSAYLVTNIFGFSLLPDFPIQAQLPSELSDPCEAVRDIALNGSTLDIRFAAILALMNNLVQSDENGNLGSCTPPMDASESELVERAKAGDLEAAVNLSVLIREQIQAEADALEEANADLSDDELIMLTDSLVDKLLSELGLDILENTERFDLLALAYATASVELHVSDLVLEIVIDFPELLPDLP